MHMTDEQIIELICKGGASNHSKAISAFYSRWAIQMKGFFITKGLTTDDAEDVFQDCVVTIWRKAHQYKGQGTAQSWVWCIARNVLTDQLRKKKPNRHFVDLDDALENILVAPSEVENTASDCVDDGLKNFELIDSDRAYALQLWCNEMDLQDIADRIGRSYGATRTYLTECRKKLRPFVEPCLELLTA